jgi:hypothetical protein
MVDQGRGYPVSQDGPRRPARPWSGQTWEAVGVVFRREASRLRK